MFLVLVVHADYFSLSVPGTQEFFVSPFSSVSRVFFESLSIGCVDMFVLLSGWFGIHPKIKSFANFVYQCLFFLIGIYVFCLITGLTSFSVKGVAGCFVMLKWNWFIKAYIGLYLLSPVLNAYVEKASEKQLRLFLIYFYLFQTLYSWCTGAAEFFMNGYSTMSFIGLYMLARYFHLYPNNKLTQQPRMFDLGVFMGIVTLQTVLVSGVSAMGWLSVGSRFFSYVNPLVVISSFYLLLFFSKLKFQYNAVNWISASSFAVFLLHTNPNLCRPYFVPFVQTLYERFDGLVCLSVLFLFLLCVFGVSVMIDRIRLWSWNGLWSYYEKKHI